MWSATLWFRFLKGCGWRPGDVYAMGVCGWVSSALPRNGDALALYAFRFCADVGWMDGWRFFVRAGCEKSGTQLELMRCGARKSKVASHT